MTDNERPGRPADAELADAVESIQSIGEDWRSSERGTEDSAPAERGNDDEEHEHG